MHISTAPDALFWLREPRLGRVITYVLLPAYPQPPAYAIKPGPGASNCGQPAQPRVDTPLVVPAMPGGYLIIVTLLQGWIYGNDC
jgi:hypothetical protein